jgi:hypothetical protein
VLTLFSIPKPFEDLVDTIQRNALRSWCALDGVEVLVLGDEPGTADTAAEFGVQHLGGLVTNERGTPRLDDAFARVEATARYPLRCFVNADIVFLDDFRPALQSVQASLSDFLAVGETREVAVIEALPLDEPEGRVDLRRRALAEGRSRGATAIDYFVYSEGLFGSLPPFVVGRAGFDNWLVWSARAGGAAVVDMTRAVLAVHQSHDYSHVPGGQNEAHFGVEAARNLSLAGGKRQLYTIYDASYRLAGDGRMRRNLAATFRLRENARKASWKVRHR